MTISPFMQKMLEKKKVIDKEKEERSQYVKVDWFKPKDGEQKIRLLPHIKELKSKEHKLDAIREVWLHYVGRGSGGFYVRCEKDIKDSNKCPFCEKSKALYEAAGDSKEKKAKAKDFKAIRRFLVNILNYEEKKIQPWAFGPQVFEEIVEFLGGDYGNPFDLETGRDWKLKKLKDPAKGKLGVSYKMTPVASESKIPDKAKNLFDGLVDLGTLYNESGLKSMKKFLGEDDEDAEDTTEFEEKKKKVKEDKEDWDDEPKDEKKSKKKSDDDWEDEKASKTKTKKDDDDDSFDLDSLGDDSEISEDELDGALE